MALIYGRPISFQMDLYQPLYVPRPWWSRNYSPPCGRRRTTERWPTTSRTRLPRSRRGSMTSPAAAAMGMGCPAVLAACRALACWVAACRPAGSVRQPLSAKRRRGQPQRQAELRALQQRRTAKEDAKKAGSAIAAMDPREGVEAAASGEAVGDHYQYVIDQRVSLARQKSAMIPIIDRQVTGSKVSIFNESVHRKFPLLGLKFKNASGQHLMQGPLTVYEGGSYAGDARILDMQPDEERLLSYAVDLGTEVKVDAQDAPDS